MRENDYDLVREASSEETRKVVRNTKGRSGPGTDGIPAILVKRSLYMKLRVFVYIFNRIISDGVWPSTWMTLIMVPIFKGGSARDHESYRLIALAPLLSKILEKSLDSWIDDWLEGTGVMKEE